MAANDAFLTGFNGLARAEASLPVGWYRDPLHHEREMESVWRRSWLPFCRTTDLAAPLDRRAGTIAGRNILVLRDAKGGLAGYHNVCRHRGSEICAAGVGKLEGPRLVCPYHQWAYDLAGRLRGPSTGSTEASMVCCRSGSPNGAATCSSTSTAVTRRRSTRP